MINHKISTGDIMEVLPIDQQSASISYPSKVEAVDSRAVLIHAPIDNLDYVRLPLNKHYWLHFAEKLVRYKASVSKHVKKDDFNFIEFTLLEKGQSLQKRDYFRLSCNIPVKFRSLGKYETGGGDPDELHNGILSDLSGGGVKMQTDMEMEEKDEVFLSFYLDNDAFHLLGEIRAKYYDPSAKQRFQYGIIFSVITELERDRIVRYLFNQQKRRVRQK